MRPFKWLKRAFFALNKIDIFQSFTDFVTNYIYYRILVLTEGLRRATYSLKSFKSLNLLKIFKKANRLCPIKLRRGAKDFGKDFGKDLDPLYIGLYSVVV